MGNLGDCQLSTSHSVQEIELAERTTELAVLLDSFTRCSDSRYGAVITVEGPPGTGRTSLLRTFTEHIVTSDAMVLTATCSRLERDLPLAVVHQLLQSGEPEADPTLARLVEEAMGEPEAVDRLLVPAQQATLARFQQLAARRRLVVVIDDAHDMDAASAHCLLFALRRLGPAQVLFVLSQADAAYPGPYAQEEWSAQPDRRVIRLAPLTEGGVRKVVTSRLGVARARFADSCYAATGGSPRLVQAVLDDHLAQAELPAPPADPCEPVLGEYYDRAVLECLHRGSPAALRIARGTALLDHATAPTPLSRLLDLEPNAVDAGLAELTAIGLLHEGRFRHDRSRLAVLGSMAATERAELHWRTAHVLHDAGEPNRAVVDHLIAAGKAPSPWAIDVLYAAARAAASEHDAEFAKTCLELTAWSTTDERQRAKSHAMLLDILWRMDPLSAEPHVAKLTELMQCGRLGADEAVALIKHQLWCGRISAAASALTWLRPKLDDPEVAAAPSVRILQLWLGHSFPRLASLLPAPSGRPNGAEPALGVLLNGIDARLRSADTLLQVLTGRSSRHVLLDTRQVLQSRLCHDLSFESVHSALLTLLYSEQLAESAECCDAHLVNAAKRDGSPCHCILLALRAEISLRSGDLRAAEAAARTAVELFAEGRWSAVSELPLSTLLSALVRLGRLDEAAELVRRPLPLGFLQSRAGLTYRYAVGEFRLAAGDPDSALHAFLECGNLAVAWHLDAPTLVPWREGAAEALHRTGQTSRAEELLREQLRLAGDRYPRVRGTTLRLLAELTPGPVDRKQLLTEAADLVRGAGARYELARVLLDLAAVHSSLGKARRARMEAQLAQEVANECGATSLAPLPDPAQQPSVVLPEQRERLSHAERRVAFLAARGHTNREIAEQLFITRSTVEQHLTRVFRKLKVKQREELPLTLGLHKADQVFQR